MAAPTHTGWMRKLLRCVFLGGALMAAQAQAGVSVEHGRLLRDDRPWTPHGIVQIAFVAPPAAQQGVFADAYQHYSPADYTVMRRFGIDSVRIQASQPGLDPNDPLFRRAFQAQVIAAVHAARAAGLVVMLSIQDEKQSGETHGVAALPNEATRRVWKSLAPVFAGDMGVMYELLNEPNLVPSPDNWRKWADAMNTTLAVVRRAGARNVAVADGLLFAERLAGAPDLRDPLGQVVYASHPYAHHQQDQEQAAWEAKFGDFARTHPVIVTEWATVPKYYCDLGTPPYAENLLAYLDQRHIGLMAYGWDFSGAKFGSTFHGFPPQPTAFQGLRCGDASFGPGRAVERLYLGRGQAPDSAAAR
jgi:endoglucanase